MSTLPYPRSKLRALLKTWASEPPPPLPPASPSSTSDPTTHDSPAAQPARPHTLGPTVDAVAFVAWSVFIRKLGEAVARQDEDEGGLAKGAKGGKGRAAAGRKSKGRKVKVGRVEVRRAKRVSESTRAWVG